MVQNLGSFTSPDHIKGWRKDLGDDKGGAISVSVGDVIAFALTVCLSYLLAHLVDFVLQADVFTRVETGRGVPYAISGLVRYTLIFLGLLVGLSAAGFELSKLTVILGGLGIGVGFGLQNVVSNFVSGLILLFERPIQVGDAVQLAGVWVFFLYSVFT